MWNKGSFIITILGFFQVAFSNLVQNTSCQWYCASFLVVIPKLHRYLWCYQFDFWLWLGFFIISVLKVLGSSLCLGLHYTERYKHVPHLTWACKSSVILWEATDKVCLASYGFAQRRREPMGSPMEGIVLPLNVFKYFLCSLLFLRSCEESVTFVHSRWNVCSSILIPASQQPILVLSGVVVFQ